MEEGYSGDCLLRLLRFKSGNFQVFTDPLKHFGKLFHFFRGKAFPDTVVYKGKDLLYLESSLPPMVCEADGEGAAAAGVPLPDKISGILQAVNSPRYGSDINMAEVSQLLLGNVVPHKEGFQNSGLPLTKGKAYLGKIWMEDVLACLFAFYH